jgi:hypothetical protein
MAGKGADVSKIVMGSFTAEEIRHFHEIFVRVAAVLQASQNLLADAIDPAAPGSPNNKARTNQVWDAYEQVGALLYSAEDHLRTMFMIFEGTQLPTYSLYTLLRAAAEAIVRCAYLLDPGLTEPQRLARGLNLRWENLDEVRKLDHDDPRFAERVAHLEERAVANGIEVVRKSDGKQPHFGEGRKNDVDLFAQYVQSIRQDRDPEGRTGEKLYRFLSAHVHSMIWVKLFQAQTAPTDEAGMNSVKLDLEFDQLAGMLLMVLRLHESNIANLLKLSGYPIVVWDLAKKTAIEDAKERLRILGERQQEGNEGP